MAEKARGIGAPGIAAMHRLAQKVGLVAALDEAVDLLKIQRPYSESDHILNIAFNILAGGTNLESLECRRNDENYMDAVGTARIPDPTTAGDFCRRFSQCDIESLLECINQVRLKVWSEQPAEFFREATLDVDATVVQTLGKCKEGADFSYDGKYGYIVLVISLAETDEVLHLSVRGANRSSNEGAAEAIRLATNFCRTAGFKKVTVRGDTDYSLTREFDSWDASSNAFVTGYNAFGNLVQEAEDLPQSAWKPLSRRDKNPVKTTPRDRPTRYRDVTVRDRGFLRLSLELEEVSEFEYQPRACSQPYRVVVVRKSILIEKGQKILNDAEVRHLFYATNDREAAVEDIVFAANDRCAQEKIFSQLGETGILYAPLGDLLSNWAYMAIASLAWTMKCWFSLLLPETGPWKERRKAEKDRVLRMSLRTFIAEFMTAPVQIVRTARKTILRFLSWSPWRATFFRAWDRIQILRC